MISKAPVFLMIPGKVLADVEPWTIGSTATVLGVKEKAGARTRNAESLALFDVCGAPYFATKTSVLPLLGRGRAEPKVFGAV